MKKRRGHYCRICRKIRPNEAFSGKGHRIHVCKRCACLPKEKREEIEHEDEIFSYLNQSHISEKNVSRLKKLAVSPNERIAELARVYHKSERYEHKSLVCKVLCSKVM